MPTSIQEPGPTPQDAVRLALARLEEGASFIGAWSPNDAAALRAEAARSLRRQGDAAVMIGASAASLMRGIALVPFLASGGAFGPAWPGHPFASTAMGAGYRLREPDVTRELERLMGPAAGRRGTERAICFLRLVTEGVRSETLRAAITDHIRPTVKTEHLVVAPQRRSTASKPPPGSAGRRIDLLFEWPTGTAGQKVIVVVEAKLGAEVSEGQLKAYRAEALRRARGGPVGLVLLTAWADAAERHNPSWACARWFTLLRRWEGILAEAGDDDPEFARVRAHLWRFVLSNRRAYR